MRPDGADIRVLGGNRVVPHEVVFIGPGDRVSLLFAYRPGRTEYYIYYGNPEAEAVESDWTVRRGLLLETRPYNGGKCGNWAEMQQTLERAGEPYGRGLVETIFHGYNPFGPSHNMVSVYRGWLHMRKAEETDIALSSASAAFCFLDGELFLQWPGWHGAMAQGRFHKTVTLKPGPHLLEYYHVQRNANPIMALVWKRPNEPRYKPIPIEFFLPPLTTTLVDFRMRDNPRAPDFDWSNDSQAEIEGRRLVTMAFRDTKPSTGRRRLWNFGDGVTSTKAMPKHVYLAPGTYTVTLSFPRAQEAAVCRQRVVVDRDWSRQPTLEPEPLDKVAGRIRNYPYDALSGKCFLGALLLYGELGRADDILRVGEMLQERLAEVPDDDACEAVVIVGKARREAAGEPEKAIALYRAAEEKIASDALRARLAICIGDTLYYDMDKGATASPEYERVVKRYAAAQKFARLAWMRLGDVARCYGKAGEARHAYRRSLELSPKKPAQRRALDLAMRALETEDLLRRNLPDDARDALYQWQWQDPEEKLRGQWSALMIRCNLLAKDVDAAVKEGEIILLANPESQFTPEILLRLAEAYELTGHIADARKTLERIGREYPESPLVKDAGEILRRLPVPEEKATPAP